MSITKAQWDEIGVTIAQRTREHFKLTKEQWAALSPAQRLGYGQRWRLGHLYWIENEQSEKVKFRPTPIQRDFLSRVWWRNVILKARQVRLSTVWQLLCLDRTLFEANHTAGVVDKTDEDAKRKLARIKFAYDHLDDRDDPETASLGALLKQVFTLRIANAHEIQFGNESKIWASTSMRGGTINTLWVSELGVTAMEFPEKAVEIRKGALNAIHEKALAGIEATFAGGRTGVFYSMIQLAMRTPRNPAHRSPIQWAFHFYGWSAEPSYAVRMRENRLIAPKLADKFATIERATGSRLTPEQKNWYVIKSEEQGADMTTEFPGTAEEALQAIPEGAIYGDLMQIARATGRICPLTMDGQAPLFTAWDLGESDACAVWLLQIVGPWIHALDFHCANGATPAEHVAAMQLWERKWKRPIANHYLPHDGAQRKAGSSWYAELKKAGLENLRIVDRIANVWIGIGQTRQTIPSMRFNSDTCEKEFPMADGETVWPSGVAALEAYRKKAVAASGNITWIPIHDECESGASSLRTFCEARARGMLVGPSKQEQDSRRVNAQQGNNLAKMGLSRPGYKKNPTQPRAIMR